ncbi:MAG TPA: hypothetical protein VGV18_07160 [Verrucomicrobiae bacterium]|nr:hypothetical protein [Verrucomicrobiae bacterium]
MSPQEIATALRESLPTGGLFAGLKWRTSVAPFPLEPGLAKELQSLGRVLLQFYRAVNVLYRKSVEGKLPDWIARWFDLGKPPEMIALQRAPGFKNDVPRVIRPDILLTDDSFCITELDSVPGGIGLTAWLNQTYSEFERGQQIVGGKDGMNMGFGAIFGHANRVHIIVSDEAATYRPEMEWLAAGNPKLRVRDSQFDDFAPGDAVYRFFELFDTANVPNANRIFSLAAGGKIRLTPPPKTIFEEKMLFALLWNWNLRDFWRQELGDAFFTRLKHAVPYTWLLDPTPLPPHGAFPELNITDWRQLKALSQKDRNLILKVSGYSEKAWGARGVFFGSDLSHADWAAAVDQALTDFNKTPFVLQRYERPKLVESSWFDFDKNAVIPVNGRVRLCPYYFVTGDGDAARPELGGILATVVPADKKIIHGMAEAILAPCAISPG